MKKVFGYIFFIIGILALASCLIVGYLWENLGWNLLTGDSLPFTTFFLIVPVLIIIIGLWLIKGKLYVKS